MLLFCAGNFNSLKKSFFRLFVFMLDVFLFMRCVRSYYVRVKTTCLCVCTMNKLSLR